MKLNEVSQLIETGTEGVLLDANDHSVRLSFESGRADLSKRSIELIREITRLVKIAQAGQDATAARKYFRRYQPFIDAGTTEFEVQLISTFHVNK